MATQLTQAGRVKAVEDAMRRFTSDSTGLATAIWAWRDHYKLTQKELGALLGMKGRQISNMECGRARVSHPYILALLMLERII